MSLGEEFLESLKELGYPEINELTPSMFDWLQDDERVAYFLKDFCKGVKSGDLYVDKETEELDEDDENKALELLDTVKEELENQINELEDKKLALNQDLIVLSERILLEEDKLNSGVKKLNKLLVKMPAITNKLRFLKENPQDGSIEDLIKIYLESEDNLLGEINAFYRIQFTLDLASNGEAYGYNLECTDGLPTTFHTNPNLKAEYFRLKECFQLIELTKTLTEADEISTKKEIVYLEKVKKRNLYVRLSEDVYENKIQGVEKEIQFQEMEFQKQKDVLTSWALKKADNRMKDAFRFINQRKIDKQKYFLEKKNQIWELVHMQLCRLSLVHLLVKYQEGDMLQIYKIFEKARVMLTQVELGVKERREFYEQEINNQNSMFLSDDNSFIKYLAILLGRSDDDLLITHKFLEDAAKKLVKTKSKMEESSMRKEISQENVLSQFETILKEFQTCIEGTVDKDGLGIGNQRFKTLISKFRSAIKNFEKKLEESQLEFNQITK